jgi:hypothetical protein
MFMDKLSRVNILIGSENFSLNKWIGIEITFKLLERATSGN